MSFFDDSSLAFLPSGAAGKDGKAYSIKPTNGTGDFTFSRGSNLAATRVGPTGLIEKGRENLLLQSNQFDTTWAGNTSNRSITSGFSGYDGTNNAWKLEAISDNNYSVVNQLVSNTGVETFSVYAKAGTSNAFRIQITGGVNTSASYFDLSGSGSVGVNFNNIDAKIESVGNGWFRCSVTGNKTTSSSCVIYVIDAEGSTNVTTGANIYIQDAQLEIGLAATDYIESGATTGKAGLLEDEPRFDYSGGATCPSLLLEPSRTQLVKYSELINPTISGLSWAQVASNTFTNNYGTAPDGTQTSTRVQFINPNSSSQLFAYFTSTATQYTGSIYLKGSGTLNLGFYDNTNVLTDSITLTSDWKRFDVTKTLLATSNARFWIYPNGVGSAQDFEIWGAQTEQGSYPTSYIPNHSGGTITRGVDGCSVTGVSSLIGQTEGTIYWEIDFVDVGNYTSLNIRGINDGDRILIQRRGNNNYLQTTLEIGYVSQVNYTNGAAVLNGVHKIAFMYSENNFKTYLDGVLVGSDTSGSTFTNQLNNIFINPNSSAVKTKQVIVFPTALSDADLATLTTI